MKYYAVIDTNVIVSVLLKSTSVPGNILELPDPKDRVFYEVTIEGRKKENTRLVTGNIKHFPEKTFVVTPRQMLDIIINDTE